MHVQVVASRSLSRVLRHPAEAAVAAAWKVVAGITITEAIITEAIITVVVIMAAAMAEVMEVVMEVVITD